MLLVLVAKAIMDMHTLMDICKVLLFVKNVHLLYMYIAVHSPLIVQLQIHVTTRSSKLSIRFWE